MSELEIITGNYQLVYYVAEKCGHHRDTDVSKNLRFARYYFNILKVCITDFCLSKCDELDFMLLFKS